MPDHADLITRLEKAITQPTCSIVTNGKSWTAVEPADGRDAIAALKSAPGWHDAPTCEGLWIVSHVSWNKPELESWTQEELDSFSCRGWI